MKIVVSSYSIEKMESHKERQERTKHRGNNRPNMNTLKEDGTTGWCNCLQCVMEIKNAKTS